MEVDANANANANANADADADAGSSTIALRELCSGELMNKIHKMMLNLYSTYSLSNITNAFIVTLQDNIQNLTLLVERYWTLVKYKNLKKQRKKNPPDPQQGIEPGLPAWQTNNITTTPRPLRIRLVK